MSNVFFISDTHLGHEKIITFGHRIFASIEEHDEMIVSNWNSVVGKTDTVRHQGDVCVGGDLTERVINCLKRLNGRIFIVPGNHDTRAKLKKYAELGFIVDTGMVEFKGDFALTHPPVHVQQVETRFKANIHGHLHSDNITRKIFRGTDWVVTKNDEGVLLKAEHVPFYDEELDPRYVNVSCEQIGLTPVSFDVIKDRLRKAGVI